MKTRSLQANNTQLDFSGQVFFVGIDVHKKSWHVTIRSNGMRLHSFSMNPSAKELGVQKTLCKWQISPLLSVGEGINKDPASGAKR